ncbi:DNA-3-methyladenine glycosylase 2 family protein [Rugosimonospora africana]|uniref:DNA-3-methyladenine glycosylase II n=1 Tax=Rugosimonospora africana TaxID=556532 RepID=A0A8J3VMY2_9ACTN|nr:AlkA N-terminal domain-containing protein [Rugosimonospora africana]GIH12684.1 DNA-3-methyladenine glycosylase [Rugosimonospora africana]
MELEFERCYRAVDSRDPRFDGWFVTAVTSTGIYCRPSCPAITPKRTNVRFYPSAAAAQRAGFRACKRCRPDAAPGSPEWDVRADVVGRAMRLIGDGVVDREGVPGLAARLAYTTRHLNRILTAELGAGPLALARAQRAQTARTLVEATDLGLAEIAFAAGFGSVRQFNDTLREVYACAPSVLREAARRRAGAAVPGTEPAVPGTLTLRLAYRPPLDAATLLEFLAMRAVPGVEVADTTSYTRALRLPHGPATVVLTPTAGYVSAALRLTDLRDLAPAVARCRRLLDLDADPVAVDETLGADPLLAPAVAKVPGLRVPRAVDGFEIAVRAIVGQQISVAGARTVLGRLVAIAGRTAERTTDRTAGTDADGGSGDPALTPFPDAAAVAGAPDEAFAMPVARRNTIRALAGAVASGDLVLDDGADRADTEATLLSLPGIGVWTAGYIAMRALGDPDVFLPSDLAVRRGAAAVGLPTDPAALAEHAQRWRPWRSYAVLRLWQLS